MGNYDLTEWQGAMRAQGRPAFDDCSCKRISCALRHSLHWAVRRRGVSGWAVASLPTSTIHWIDRATASSKRNPTTTSSSNYRWWATSFHRSRCQSHAAPFRARSWWKRKADRVARVMWKERRHGEEEGTCWQANSAGLKTLHVGLHQDGCQTWTPLRALLKFPT